MVKRIILLVGLLLLVGMSSVEAQDVLQVLAIDYMGEALEASGIYDRGFDVELTVVDQQAMREVLANGRLQSFDVVIADNQILDPFLPELGPDVLINICDRVPEFCDPPQIIDICETHPWVCGNPCTFVPGVGWWDCRIILDPWEPMEWNVDILREVVDTEQVMIDPRNGVGFFWEPAIFDIARPNFTINRDEAFLVFTPACNYVARFDEFEGFPPIVVEGYEETPFNVNAYVIAEGSNVDLGVEFAAMLLTDTELQLEVHNAIGLLPGNLDVLAGVLPNERAFAQ